MDYQKIYHSLINRAKNRDINGITQRVNRHHIQPISIAPELRYQRGNIVFLTEREHYIAHHLLAHIYTALKTVKAQQKAYDILKRVYKKQAQNITSAIKGKRAYNNR